MKKVALIAVFLIFSLGIAWGAEESVKPEKSPESPWKLAARYGNYNGDSEFAFFPLYRLNKYVAWNSYTYYANKKDSNTAELTTGPKAEVGMWWGNLHGGLLYDPAVMHLTYRKAKFDTGLKNQWFEITSQSNYMVAGRKELGDKLFERAWITAGKETWGLRIGPQSEFTAKQNPLDDKWGDQVMTLGPRTQITIPTQAGKIEFSYYYGAVVKNKKDGLPSPKNPPPTSTFYATILFK